MERIHVSVRARPLSAEDSKSSPWRISSDSIFIPNQSSKFDFDHIFGQDCKTIEVYQSRTKEIVGAAVRGFNGTVFAYGQTNSGKTYTMRGSDSEPGVIPLAVRDLFDAINQDINREFLLRMSYMEIYNEEINDLLVPEHRRLQIHESIERGIYVAGLREEIVVSPEQVLSFMEFGESHRHVGETNMNVHSSRSHTIFRMIIESRDRTEDGDTDSSCDAVRVSVLNLVDLAGSERAAKTGAEGIRLKEGSHINKSLMTLGTVIKKLSEGAESQGGHVPYRDSKLTRILQPALGGNANTAIICNITLAQIHADETKSSLQFASRAIRVKNSAHVNEILTDAALLKRQKKEIEDLREKLQGSHSEHSEEEILNLRNTLLQTELERERIALELEEERKAQAEYEKMVQEQAKKIESLSSMVLSSNRDDHRDRTKKEKRRDTWCPGNLSRETIEEIHSSSQSNGSAIKAIRAKTEMAPLVPFKDLMESIPEEEPPKEDEDSTSNSSEDYKFPDQCALVHVTNRRKPPHAKKIFPNEYEVIDVQAKYEDLLVRFETQRLESDMQIDYLTKKLAESEQSTSDSKGSPRYCENGAANNEDELTIPNDIESIDLIRRLQEEIKMLEMEKASSQQNVANIVELATEQNLCAQERFEELYGKLRDAREEARVAHEQLTSTESEGNSTFINKLLIEVQDVISEAQGLEVVIDSISSHPDEVSKTFLSLLETFHDFKTSMCQSARQERKIIANYENLNSFLMQEVSKLENEKCNLSVQSVELQNQIEELKLKAEVSEKSLSTILEQHDLEKEEYLSHIQILERELSNVSSSSLIKEKESLRKDLDKTKAKLKDTEFKLKNAMQEKTKIEGAKAIAEREIKRLNGQNSLLERDINKRESFAGRRRESFVDKNLKMGDLKKQKGLGGSIDQAMQEENRKMEVYAFELETKIASLEEELSALCVEREENQFIIEELTSERDTLSEKLNTSNEALSMLQEEVAGLRQKLEDSKSELHKMESSRIVLLDEKEELSMQLSDSLLEMEEEKAVWSAKEKASIEAIEEKAKLYNTEIMSLSKELSEVRIVLESRTQECNALLQSLTCLEEDRKKENISVERIPGNNQLHNSTDLDDLKANQSHEEMDVLRKELSFLKNEREDLLLQIRELAMRPDLSDKFQCLENQLFSTTEERDKLKNEIDGQQARADEIEFIKKTREDMLEQAKAQVEELTKRILSMEVETRKNQTQNNAEMAKHRLRLKWTQKKLDAFRERYMELVEENNHMSKTYEEASGMLKEKLASKRIENLNLRKQILNMTTQ